MFYDRQVRYLDYIVNGERCGNAGFIKIEVRDNACNININVTGLKLTDSVSVKMYIMSSDKECELCSLDIVQGKGREQLWGLDAHNIGGTGIAYHALEAVRIPVGAGREIHGVLENKVGQTDKDADREVVGKNEPVENEPVENEPVENEPVEDEISDMSTENEEVQKDEPVKIEHSMSLQDTKWKQLWAIYPHVSPFRDEREYLSVGPGDFVILPEKYFRLVNNSFLLHGYYNYRHLVLKRMEHPAGVRYYIGVPGNFYDREKQVAVMFGFESFESLEESAQTGDFGYYLMQIEL